MKICVDIQSAVAQRAGVGRYTRMLVEHLGATSDADELVLFYFDFRRRRPPLAVAGARQRVVRWVPGRVMQQCWKRLRCPPYEWLAGRADLYHFPNFIVPPLTFGRAVVTIHDVSFLRHPEFTETRNLAYLRARLHATVSRAAAIITDSAFCEREIAELLPASRGKLHSVHPGLGPEFVPADPAALAGWRRRRGLERPYLLAVGTYEPRKNFGLLPAIFEQLPDFDGDLVIAGRRGWKYESFFARVAASPRASSIRLLEDVDDAELPWLYAGAALFLFPSFYEGFGFPPLEAMACGVPVLASAGGSLPEVLGDGAAILNSGRAEDWRDAAAELLGNAAARDRLVERGRRQAARYSWTQTARRTWAIYREAMQ